MIELIVSNLNDSSLVIKNNIPYLDLLAEVFEEYVLDDLLFSLVLFAKHLLSCLAHDPLAPRLSLVVHFLRLLQTCRVK